MVDTLCRWLVTARFNFFSFFKFAFVWFPLNLSWMVQPFCIVFPPSHHDINSFKCLYTVSYVWAEQFRLTWVFKLQTIRNTFDSWTIRNISLAHNSNKIRPYWELIMNPVSLYLIFNLCYCYKILTCFEIFVCWYSLATIMEPMWCGIILMEVFFTASHIYKT